MPKQTKMIKFMLVVLIIIPMVLFITGVVQTFVLKSKQNELYNSQYTLSQTENKKKELSDEADYKESTEYKEEKDKHNGYTDKDKNDIILAN